MLDDEIREDYERLAAIAERCTKSLAAAPTGTLRVAKTKHGVRYYARDTPGKCQGRYLKGDDLTLANRLAQKRYDEKVLKAVGKEMQALRNLADCRGLDLENSRITPCSEVRQAYIDLNDARRELILPYDVPDEEYARAWQAEEYTGKAFDFGESSFFTDRGEKVRSKSEILIANKLFHKGIPYHYERPLWLNDRNPIYPDFTVLNVRTRKVYYWEHMGMMGDAEYSNNALRRIIAYESANIFLGDSLILTFESGEVPLDMRSVESILVHYLL